jgi:hypothetical protein
VSAAHTDLVLSEVAAERERQVERWGRQYITDNDGTDDGTILLGRSYAVLENTLKARCDHLAEEWRAGRLPDPRNMTTVLLEEVFEALSQAVAGNPEELRKELVQVAAVAVKWAEILDHRAAEAAGAEIDAATAGLYAATGRVRMRKGLSFDEAKSLRTHGKKIVKAPAIVELELPEQREETP